VSMPASIPLKSFARTQLQFTQHLRSPAAVTAPSDVPAARMAVYRELVYGNIERMIANLFPVLRKITADEAWFALVQDFFQHHQCRAGLFTKVPQEFVQFMAHERDLTQDPPCVLELVQYEAIDYAVTIDPHDIDRTGVNYDGDLLTEVPVLNPIARLLAYQYPVHKISPDFIPESPPEVPTYLVVCRDRDDKVGFIDLNPVAARLLELIQQAHGITGRGLLERIALELAHPDPEAVVAGGREILERLRARDVLLGARAQQVPQNTTGSSR
jgi:uncharacterized protein